MLALLILLPTLAYVPIYFFIFPALYIIIRAEIQGDKSLFTVDFSKVNSNFILLTIIVLASLLNKIIHHNEDISLSNFLPYTVATFVTYFIAKNIRKRDFEWLVFFISIEGIIVFVEYYLGVNTFFESLDLSTQISADKLDLMYYTRPFGLSMNSSIVGYKLLLGYLILDYFKLNKAIHTLLRVLLIAAIYITFNRTIFLVMIIYFGISAIRIYGPIIEGLLDKKIKRQHVKFLFIGCIGLIAVVAVFVLYGETILNQLTRGRTDKVDLSGRDHIWAGFIEFIKSNWMFGNGSEKYAVPHGDGLAHAHNSFLQIIATHGVFIFVLYLVMVFRNISRKNFLFIITLLIYSFFQYGMFWGISLLDIFLFKILFFPDKAVKKQNTV